MNHTSLAHVHVHNDFRGWEERFAKRRARLDRYHGGGTKELTARERALITPSIRDFQKGEGSDGAHLLATARRHALLGHDAHYLACLQAFVREEQTHSATLAAFMGVESIPLKTRSVLDYAFRLLRRLGGLELSVRVLMTAEILGIVYYQALQRSTRSASLRQICQWFLEDEREHLVFESFALAQVNRFRAPWKNAAIHGTHGAFLLVTACALWMRHRALFRAKKQSFHGYLNEAIQLLTDCLARMNVGEATSHNLLWEATQ